MVCITLQLVLASCIISLAVAIPVPHKNGFVTIPISRPNVTSRNPQEFLAKEKNRINGFSAATTGSAPAINEDVTYVAATTVGSQVFNLIIDTGSSNTWVGAGTTFVPGSTGASTGNSVSVTYGSGSFSGTEYTDTVTLGGLTVSQQSIGVASSSSGFQGVDGIIGFGPVDLTQGTVSNQNTVPTFLDNLYSQGTISVEVLGVYFKPESGSDTNDQNGELTLGGVDSSKYTGSIGYTTKTGSYWGVTVSGINYGSTSLLGSSSAIVDTGTTLIYIPSSAYSNFLSASGGHTDQSSGLAAYSTQPTSSVTFTIGGVSYSLTPSQYLIPSAQYSYYSLSSGTYYSWISDGGSSGVDFIIGQKFLENYYSVYDTTNNRVGLATRA